MARHLRQNSRLTAITPSAVFGLLLAVTVVAAVTAVALADGGSAPGGSCPTAVRVVTAASYAPVLTGVAPTVADGPDCARVEVTVADGRAAAERVAEVGADLWIPDDAGWAGNPGPAQLAAEPAGGAGTVLAVSPFYLVTDRDTARRIEGAGGGWLALANLVTRGPSAQARLAVRDPGGSGDGMLGAGAFAEAVWLESGMDASAEALAEALPVTRTVTGDEPALPEAPGEVGLVPEHALLPVLPQVRDAGSTVLAPGDHTAALRYTWLPTAAAVADPGRLAALDRLARALAGPEADRPLVEAGLRRPGGGPPAGAVDGLPTVTAPMFDVLGPHNVDHVLASWYAADRRSDVLVAIDVSGSMAARAPGTQRPLIDVVKDGVRELSTLLPDDSQMTLWKFGTRLDGLRDHAVVLDRVSLDGSSREKVERAVGTLAPGNTGTGLHDTILAAYESAQTFARPDVPRHVVVFTDGRNEADSVTLTLDQLGERLAAVKDPQRPVELTVVTFGGQPEADALSKTLEPVDGYLDPLRTADQVKAAFIHAAAGGVHD